MFKRLFAPAGEGVDLGGGGGSDVADLGGNLDSAMDAAASGADTGDAGGDGEGEPAVNLDSAMDEIEGQPQQDATDQPADGDGPAQEVAPVEEGVKPWGKDHFQVTKPALEALKAHREFANSVKKLMPDMKAVEQTYNDAADLVDMHHDFMHPDSLDKWMSYWKNENPDSFNALTNKIVENLHQTHPEIHKSIQAKAADNYWNNLYAEAEKAGDTKKFHEIQKVQYQLEGKYKEKFEKFDPLKEERESLDRRTREFETRAERDRNSYWSRLDGGIKTNKSAGVKTLIDAALKPAEGKFSKERLEAFRDSIVSKIDRKVADDFNWNRNHKIGHEKIQRAALDALKKGQRIELGPHVKSHVDEYVAYARPIVQEMARLLIGQETAAAVTANQQQHQRLKDGQRPGSQGNRPPTAPFKKAAPANATFDQLFESV